MNKGIIATNYKHRIVVLHEFIDDGGRVVYEELDLHPFYKNYQSFVLGDEVLFQYANECTIHYPKYCDCFKKKTYALVVPKNKLNLIQKLKKLFKR
jgi:hypothetical protein